MSKTILLEDIKYVFLIRAHCYVPSCTSILVIQRPEGKLLLMKTKPICVLAQKRRSMATAQGMALRSYITVRTFVS